VFPHPLEAAAPMPLPVRRPAPVVAALTCALAGGFGLAACADGEEEAGAKAPVEVTVAKTAPRALSTRSDLRPPKVTVATKKAGRSPGLIFLGPKPVFGAKLPAGSQTGPEIVEDGGAVRWFMPVPKKSYATDVRVQRYQGRPVLTYWLGHGLNGQGDGACIVLDQHYRQIAKVVGDGGAETDLHECNITPHDSMLVTIYENVRRDLTPVGGPQDGKVVDGVVEDVDIATGKVLFRWSSLDHIGLDESYEPITKTYNGNWDFFHANSVGLDTDGNVLVSARHTWAVYKLDYATGQVIWRLGGKKSDFAIDDAGMFAWQHDAVALGTNTLSIFNNDAGTKKVRPYSTVLTLQLDPQAHTATTVRSLHHPRELSSGTQGNGQALANGDEFVGWGSQGWFSEFDPAGKVIYDARVPRGYDSYRAYRSPWTGTPTTAPRAVAQARGDRTAVAASWSGSTEVQRWRVLAGASRGALRAVGTYAWKDLETRMSVPTSARYLRVEALDAGGKLLRRSAVVHRRG
jgi:hypothetical protein